MPRLLLLLPSTTYRTTAFVAAARRIGVDLTVASERPSTLEAANPAGLLTLDFQHPERAADEAQNFVRQHPLDAVVGVDDDSAVVAAAVAERLRLKGNSLEAAARARDKHRQRQLLAAAHVPVPRFALHRLDGDPRELAKQVVYPCVLKPLRLSASRGVIRADNPTAFAAAHARLSTILAGCDTEFLVEDFVPGYEVALEGLLVNRRLHVLALFDKPDPLDGPFFEETIYVTPSRHPAGVQSELAAAVAAAARAMGLAEGPVHAELRYNARGPWLLELAARSIGGLCSRALRFGTGLSLEELILRHALDLDQDLEREARAAGVMMIPIPRGGILREVHGMASARLVAGIEEVTITARLDNRIVPLPEGASYLGFIFARGDTPDEVEAALRRAHAELGFVIEPESPE